MPLVRYSGPFHKLTRDELYQMDQRTSKLITMHKALHSRDDVDRLYVYRKECGRGLAGIEDSVDGSMQRLEDDKEKHEKGLITVIRKDTDNTTDDRMAITRKKNVKKLIMTQKIWLWLRKGNLKRETESLQIVAQDNAIRTNHIKAKIDKTQKISNVEYAVTETKRSIT